MAMWEVHAARPVKLVTGLLAQDTRLFDEARKHLEDKYGPVDLESDVWDFDFTDYYEKDMGTNLKRTFLAFETLVTADKLPGIKLHALAIEKELSAEFTNYMRRPINVDPGYITPAKLVLATTKNREHRIYLGMGIFAEVTLRFQDGGFRPWDWTYPDYRTDTYRTFFEKVRSTLMLQV